MNIALDLDDTALEYRDVQDKWLKEHFKEAYARDSYKAFALHETWNCSREEASQRILAFYKTTAFKDLPIIPDIIPIIQALKEHNIYIMTSRPEWTRKITEAHVRKLEGKANVIFSGLILAGWNNLEKPELCKKLGIHMLIDDAKQNVEGSIGIVPHLYAPAQPWNKNVHEKVVRGTYKELLDHILTIF